VTGSILEKCADAPQQRLLSGAILLSEGETSGRLFVGAVFGEMSVLLNRPHTAPVKAASEVRVYVFV